MTITLRSATAAVNTNTTMVPTSADNRTDSEDMLPPSSQGIHDSDDLVESGGIIHRYRNNIPIESSRPSSTEPVLEQIDLDLMMQTINSTSPSPTAAPHAKQRHFYAFAADTA